MRLTARAVLAPLAAVMVTAGLWSTSVAGAADPGLTWTAQTEAAANSWYSVAYGEGVFVAVDSKIY